MDKRLRSMVLVFDKFMYYSYVLSVCGD